MEKNEFKCAMCHQVFEKTWTDEEAMDECSENFDHEFEMDDCDEVCDDCYQKMMSPTNPLWKDFLNQISRLSNK